MGRFTSHSKDWLIGGGRFSQTLLVAAILFFSLDKGDALIPR